MADVIVIGGGIAGISAASELAIAGADVTLLEAERQLAFHTTGRSAALYFENYGHAGVRALTKASRRYFEDPATADTAILSPRGAMIVSPGDQVDALSRQVGDGLRHGTDIRQLTPAEACEIVPVLRQDAIVAAAYEPGAADLDVAAIHHSFVRSFRRAGGLIQTGARVSSLVHNGRWTATTEQGSRHEGDVIVNAAGAWADSVAIAAGVRPIGLVPKRRTAFMVSAPQKSAGWPLVVDAHHTFYFKPDGPQLLCSPADETPSEPCDAKPEEIDIALAIDRINEMTVLGIRSVRSSWAGLRSFAADGGMVISFDDRAPGFFWFAGQGGTGIQTAPAAAALAADLIQGVTPRSGIDPRGFDVARLRAAESPSK
jgi:D-arginine dehydrogenase